MPRSPNASTRNRVPVLGATGRYVHLTAAQLRDFEARGRIQRDDMGRWSFSRLYRNALTAAKGKVRFKARKPAWNGGEPSGGGIYRIKPKREPDPDQSRHNAEIARARPDDTGTGDAADNALYHV